MIARYENRFRVSLVVLLLFFLGCLCSVAAQTSDATIREVRATPLPSGQGWEVIIRFDSQFDATNASETARVQTESNYRLVAINAGLVVPVDDADYYRVNGQIIPNRVRLQLNSSQALNLTDTFGLYALNLTFDNLPIAKPLNGQVTIGPSPKPPENPTWGLKTSKGRDDSDLYGAYELTAARGTATTGTGDFKLKIPFRKVFWGRAHRLGPVIDVKASSDAKADPDSLKFAFELETPLIDSDNGDSEFPFSSVYWVNSGKIEAPKNFNNINALWDSRWFFQSSHIKFCKRVRCFLDPFVGLELGKNLKSPLPLVEGSGIFRGMAGANLTLQLPIEGVSLLKGLEFESSYIRRWPLMRELLVDKDAGGNLVALTMSRGPKDYSQSKFVVKVNDFFGPYVGYEWGRLPPNYELVDHKWTFGLLFKSKIRP